MVEIPEGLEGLYTIVNGEIRYTPGLEKDKRREQTKHPLGPVLVTGAGVYYGDEEQRAEIAKEVLSKSQAAAENVKAHMEQGKGRKHK